MTGPQRLYSTDVFKKSDRKTDPQRLYSTGVFKKNDRKQVLEKMRQILTAGSPIMEVFSLPYWMGSLCYYHLRRKITIPFNTYLR